MPNPTVNPLQTLASYCFSHKIRMTKTKKGKGFMIYTPSQVTDIQRLTSLAEDCDWKVIESDDEYIKGIKVNDASIYVGHVDSKLDIESVDDFVNSFNKK